MASKRNYTIDLYRVLLLVFMNMLRCAFFTGQSGKGISLGAGTGGALAFFFIISGYFLYASFKKHKQKFPNIPISRSVFSHLLKRVIRLFPLIIITTAICFGLQQFLFFHSTPIEVWNNFWSSFPEWVGLTSGFNHWQQTAMFATEEAINTSTGFITYNPPIYFLSSMLISYTIIWALLEVCENFTKNVLGAISVPCYIWYMCSNPQGTESGTGAFFIMAVLPMLIGVFLYDFMDVLHKHEFTKKGKIALTAVNSFIVIGTFYWGIVGGLTMATGTVIFMVFTFFALLGKDYLSEALNKKCFAFLGRISIYIYAVAYGMIHVCFSTGLLSNASYFTACAVYTLVTIVAALIVMFIDEKIGVPIAKKVCNPIINDLLEEKSN